MVFDRPAGLLIEAQERTFESVTVVRVMFIRFGDGIQRITPQKSLRVSEVSNSDSRRTQVGSMAGSVDLQNFDTPGGDEAVDFVDRRFIIGNWETDL